MRAKHITSKTTLTRWFLLLLAVPLLASSCSKDSDIVTTNDYCYIKSVTLGTVKRKTATINTTFSGSSYAMTINLRDNTIENRDSLPFGSQLSRVTANIIFDGLMLTYRTKGSDAEWTAYNSADSLDLTAPLELKLTSNDNNSSRIYTFKVNVHKQEGDSLYWNMCESEVPQLADMTDMKAFIFGGKLMVLGQKAAGIVLAERSSTEAQGTWEETPITDLPTTADLQTLREQGEALYLSTSNGEILSSTDAKTWQQVGITHSATLTLVEKTQDFFYAISEGKMLRSADAITWEEESLDTKPDSLPSTNIRALTIEQANGNLRTIMVGHNDSHIHAVVWNKMWNESEEEEDAQWMFFNWTSDNAIPCPRLKHFNLLAYDGKCIAFGAASDDETHQALDAMYISQDYGITWRPSKEHHMPVELKGIESCITSTVDNNYFIWIITNAQVWRGRLNRLGFVQQ